jgi:hypothetical protein
MCLCGMVEESVSSRDWIVALTCDLFPSRFRTANVFERIVSSTT